MKEDATERTPLRVPAEKEKAEPWVDHLAGEVVPAHLSTPCRRWLSLVTFSVISAVSSGPIAMWPSLVPIFVENGTFAGSSQLRSLALVNSLAMALSTASSFLLGIVYDRAGPRTCAVAGSLGGAVGLLVMAVVTRNQELSWVLFIAYPAVTILSMLNTMGTFAWLWLLPGSANLVNSMAMAVQTLSDSLVLIVVVLHRMYGLSLETFFCVLAALGVIAAAASFAIIPNRKMHERYIAATIKAGQLSAAAEAAAAAAAEEEEEEVGGTGAVGGAGRADEERPSAAGARWEKREPGAETETEPELERLESSEREGGMCTEARAALRVAALYPYANAIFISFLFFTYTFILYGYSNQFIWYSVLFGPRRAKRLVNIFALVYGVCSSISVLLIGALMDRVGLRRLVAGVTVCALLYLGATIVPTETSQIASQFMCTLLLNIFFVVAARWALLYAPSSIFGTFSGMQMSLMALLQLISSPAVSVVSNAFFPGKSNSQTHLRFVFVFAPVGILSAISGLALILLWRVKPPPAVGEVVAPLPSEWPSPRASPRKARLSSTPRAASSSSAAAAAAAATASDSIQEGVVKLIE